MILQNKIHLKNILGFDAIIIYQLYTESSKICYFVISTYININIDIVKGWIYHGKPSDIINSFANNALFGHLINLKF